MIIFIIFVIFNAYIIVDLLKHSVLILVSETWHYRNDCYCYCKVSCNLDIFFPPSLALAEAMRRAIEDRQQGKAVSPWEAHRRVKEMYTWANVAERTEKAYDLVSTCPSQDVGARLQRYYFEVPAFSLFPCMAEGCFDLMEDLFG